MKTVRSVGFAVVALLVVGCSAEDGAGGERGSASGGDGDDLFGNSTGNTDSFGNTGATPPDFGAAGSGGSLTQFGDGTCTATGAEAEVGLEGADLIWIVDNSCSMAVEAAAVQDNMNRFATSLFDKGIDVHLALISSSSSTGGMGCPPNDLICAITSTFVFGVCIAAPFGSGNCPADSNPPNFLHVDFPVGSTNGLQLIMDQYAMYSSILRPNTKKHFVIVTDDNSDVSAATFTQWANALDPALFGNGWFFHGVYSMTQCPDAAAVGTVYADLVNQTVGVAGDLCLQQFDPVFDALAADVAMKADIACDWTIPEPPQGEVLDPLLVNVQYTQPDGTLVLLGKIPVGEQCDGREGWHYDNEASPTQVISCPAACDHFRDAGGKVDVLFGCKSEVLD